MNLKELQQYKKRSLDAVAASHIGEATAVLRQCAAEASLPPSLMSRIDAVSRDYELMVGSIMAGQPDNERAGIFEDLSARLHSLWTLIERNVASHDNPSLYFSTMRFERLHPEDDFATLVARYATVNRQLSVAREAMADGAPMSADVEAMVRANDETARRLFNRLWTGYPLGKEAISTLHTLVTDRECPLSVRSMIVSALMLGQLQYYDERRPMLLIDLYNDMELDLSLRLRALCGLLLSMWVHRGRPASRAMRGAYMTLELNPEWAGDVRMAYMQFIRARDTKRINKKFNDEVLPEMLRMRPDIQRRMREMDAASVEDNPEWEELLDKSGLKDKLKELSEMQEEGSDVFMSTFASLKNFPFFREISNWFIPFDVDNAAFSGATYTDLRGMLRLIGAAPMLCDNDKYSMALALSSLPSRQREMIAQQMRAQNDQINELTNTEVLPEDRRRENFVNKHVQDLYRFFNLFSRAREMANPFDTALNLASVGRLSHLFDDESTLSLVAEFYFKRGYFADALSLFERLQSMTPPSASLLQKIGHCRRKCGDIDGALDALLNSELLQPDSAWTLRRVAECYVARGEWEKALGYYRRVEALKPENRAVANAIAGLLEELGRHDEALKCYYKIDFLSEGRDTRALRGIARCSLMAGDTDKAASTVERIFMNNEPKADDYLLSGLVELVNGNVGVAVTRFTEALRDDSSLSLDDALAPLAPLLNAKGIDPLTTDIIIDTVNTRINS